MRGYLELNNENNPGLTPDQLRKVSEHLSLVLREVPKGENPVFPYPPVGYTTVEPGSSILLCAGEGLKNTNEPLQIDPNIKCVLTC